MTDDNTPDLGPDLGDVFLAMTNWGPEADSILGHQGARSLEGDWRPAVRLVSPDGTIELLLTTKDIRPARDGGFYCYGLVDLGNKNPEIGPINLWHYIENPETDPKALVAVDPAFKFDPNGKTIREILAEKLSNLG